MNVKRQKEIYKILKKKCLQTFFKVPLYTNLNVYNKYLKYAVYPSNYDN